jgi:alpha-N-arabinofuranosidase
MWGWGLHHYAWKTTAAATGDWWKDKSDALGFSLAQYYELLKDANRLEGLITSHWAAMAEADPEHHVKLVVDEWGAWHAPGTEPFAESLFGQQSTMRDAVLAGLTLDTFNRHADKVAMANVAQLINCLQSLFLAHEDKFCVTPTYHVFDLFTPHMGANAVRTVVSATESVSGLPGLSTSASVRGRQVTLTLTNTSMDLSRETQVTVRGGSIGTASAKTLFAKEVRAHNSLAEPNVVQPRDLAATVRGQRLIVVLPPASITRLTLS